MIFPEVSHSLLIRSLIVNQLSDTLIVFLKLIIRIYNINS